MLWKGSHMTRSPAGALSTRCWESFSPWHKWKVYILILKSKFNKVSLKLQTRTKCGTSATRAGPQSTGYVTRDLRGQREEQVAFPWQHTLKITKEDVRRLKATVSFKQIACWLVEQLWKSPSNRMSNSLSFSKIFLLVSHIPKIRQIKKLKCNSMTYCSIPLCKQKNTMETDIYVHSAYSFENRLFIASHRCVCICLLSCFGAQQSWSFNGV